MRAIRQKLRPKHQILILKCYPRTTKGAVDVKPNSSELSYLLYYATTRRSKVQKVGEFLEQKTVSDVHRAKIGNVQVTLQILAALVEKAPRDLPLYAPYVLRILNSILLSKDITMVESTIPTWDAFCENHDGATLSADQAYLRQYEEVVRIYATFASTRPLPSKVPHSAPVAMRWRVAGLQAIKSIVTSDALASSAGRQLNAIMPVILENVWTDQPDYLETFLSRVEQESEVEKEDILKRRTSMATVRTVDTVAEANALAMSGTAADADKVAEEDIGVLALQCLKQIFSVNNRIQIRYATMSAIEFVRKRDAQGEALTILDPTTGEDKGWAKLIFMMIARWTPVQDRYVILITAMDALVRCPVSEDFVPHQIVLASMIGSLLRSDINLIGLSVMDVLLGFIQHVLRILQLGGVSAHLQPESVDDEKIPNNSSSELSPMPSVEENGVSEAARVPTPARKQLLRCLQQCIGDLATHVYYADQISDMISAILLRLKPSTSSVIPNAASAIEDPITTTNVIAASTNLTEDFSTDSFFSFDTAKVTALKAIKGILLVVTKKTSASGALGRNRVGLRVWEGTQWLLRDRDEAVRKAYTDALLTWLDREMTRTDLLALDDKVIVDSSRKGFARATGDDSAAHLVRRAISNSSPSRSRPSRTAFLQLLHLAIYENALQYIEFESDIVLLHLLLTSLVNKLGVNAVKNGLPMIFRLQEDIQDAETIGKVRLGSLCHGYFWALSEKYDFESSAIGRDIHREISRRQSKGFWVELVRLPPVSITYIGTPGISTPEQVLRMHEIESESLTPFDDRQTMVELISIAYSESMSSPANSPPSSPGRPFNHPILSASPPGASGTESPAPKIPQRTKEEMLSDWSREAVITSAHESEKTSSLNGSRSGTQVTGNHRNFLSVVNDFATNNHNGGTNSGTQSPGSHHQRRSRPPSQAYGLVGGGLAMPKLRQSHGGSPAAASTSSKNSVARVDHLKRVLSGEAPPTRGVTQHSDASSDSMVSYDGALSEMSYDNRGVVVSRIDSNTNSRRASNDNTRSKSRERTNESRTASHPLSFGGTIASSVPVPEESGEDDGPDDAIPPVPPLPVAMTTPYIPGGFPADTPDIPTPIPEGDESQTPGPTSSGGAFWNPNLQKLNQSAQSTSPAELKNGIPPSASASRISTSTIKTASTDFAAGTGRAVSESNGGRVGRAPSRKLKSRGGQSQKTASWGKDEREKQGVLDLQELLRGIDTSAGHGANPGGVISGGDKAFGVSGVAKSGMGEALSGVGKSKAVGLPPY